MPAQLRWPNLNQAVVIAEPFLGNRQLCPEVIITQTAMPVNVPAVPVMPFVTELQNCNDFCFKDILASPLGCLDPILSVYGCANEVVKLDLPVSPLLPAASPVSAIAPFSKFLPPAQLDKCDSLFVKRVPIPPPFI
ncbi:unnamed protein product [Danaus chrysippus]|uniref:(African queen) hypothetical protein n=1 Tax=Danaus chrysippus TaxID=151541 RepID=A0A8J2QW66_9NEOP|nr:unnamed protein product [Danaus chrysippus]